MLWGAFLRIDYLFALFETVSLRQLIKYSASSTVLSGQRLTRMALSAIFVSSPKAVRGLCVFLGELEEHAEPLET